MSLRRLLRPALTASAVLLLTAAASAQTTQGITTATSPQPKGATGGPVTVPPSRETIHQNQGAYLQRGPVRQIEGPTTNQIEGVPQGETPQLHHAQNYPTATDQVRETTYDYTSNPENVSNPGVIRHNGQTEIGGPNGTPTAPTSLAAGTAASGMAGAPSAAWQTAGGSPFNGWLTVWLLPLAGLLAVGAAGVSDRRVRERDRKRVF